MAPVGYSYALERERIVYRQGISKRCRPCPPGIDATRCLRVHSRTGTDASHVAEMVEFIATLPPDDRLAILRSVYETMKIIAAPAREDRMTDEEIESILQEAAESSDSGAPDLVDEDAIKHASHL
jgi:hypothetical protein